MSKKNHQNIKQGNSKNKIKESYIKNNVLVKKELLGVGITDMLDRNILEFIKDSLRNNTENYYIVTPNPEMVVYAQSHPSFKTILNHAKIALCDGIGLVIGGQMLGISLKHRFTGVDCMEKVCEASKDWPITVGFLGGRGGVAEVAAKCLQQKYPGLHVAFAASEWSAQVDSQMQKKGVVADSNEKQRNTLQGQATSSGSAYYGMQRPIDILFVAYGFPKQEEWMAEHLNKIPVRIMMGVGGAFDYISGNVQRAPVWVRKMGLEWLFRLIRQPWRWKRQLALLTFLRFILAEKFSH